MTAPPTPQHDLAYAPPPPVHRRQWARRVVVIATVLLAVAILAPLAPHVLHRARLVYWQNRALAYVPPPGHVVYDDGPVDGGHPEVWTRLRALLEPTPSKASGTVFVGEMRSASGERRLVAVELHVSAKFRQARLTGHVVQPGNIVRPPRTSGFAKNEAAFGGDDLITLRVFAGRIDPGQPDLFSFRYEMDGHSRWVDGIMTGDGEVILLPRPAPTTLPPATGSDHTDD